MIQTLLALAVFAQAPSALPDSTRQALYERRLSQAVDSLGVMRGAVTAFPIDLERASPDLVLVRAARVRASCGGANAALEQVATLLAAGVYSRRARTEQVKLQSGTATLRRTLERCQREWASPDPPTRAGADSLKAWGPYRGSKLDEAVRNYLSLVREFMKRAALKKPAAS